MNFFKDKQDREKEYLAELKNKVSFNIGDMSNPQPVTYPTFDKYNQLYDPKEKKKSKKQSKLKSVRIWCR